MKKYFNLVFEWAGHISNIGGACSFLGGWLFANVGFGATLVSSINFYFCLVASVFGALVALPLQKWGLDQVRESPNPNAKKAKWLVGCFACSVLFVVAFIFFESQWKSFSPPWWQITVYVIEPLCFGLSVSNLAAFVFWVLANVKPVVDHENIAPPPARIDPPPAP